MNVDSKTLFSLNAPQSKPSLMNKGRNRDLKWEWARSTRTMGLLLLLSVLPLISACGLQPLYAGGTQGVVAQQLGQVVIDPIDGKAGWLVTNQLNDQLAPVSGNTARYRLVVRLDDQIQGFGVIANDIITRERRSLRARYQLVEIATGETVLDASAGSDAGIDVVSSEFATIAAENRALENLSREVSSQIVARLSLFAREQ